MESSLLRDIIGWRTERATSASRSSSATCSRPTPPCQTTFSVSASAASALGLKVGSSGGLWILSPTRWSSASGMAAPKPLEGLQHLDELVLRRELAGVDQLQRRIGLGAWEPGRRSPGAGIIGGSKVSLPACSGAAASARARIASVWQRIRSAARRDPPQLLGLRAGARLGEVVDPEPARKRGTPAGLLRDVGPAEEHDVEVTLGVEGLKGVDGLGRAEAGRSAGIGPRVDQLDAGMRVKRGRSAPGAPPAQRSRSVTSHLREAR